MGRDWTPQEYYYADLHMKSQYGESFRNANIVFHNKITGQTEPMFTDKQKEAMSLFPETSFLFGDYNKAFEQYSALPYERNVVLCYIEANLLLLENGKPLSDENIVRQIKDIFDSKQHLFYSKSLDDVVKGFNVVKHNSLPPHDIQKWFQGELSPTFYYNTENNRYFSEAISDSIAAMRKIKDLQIDNSLFCYVNIDKIELEDDLIYGTVVANGDKFPFIYDLSDSEITIDNFGMPLPDIIKKERNIINAEILSAIDEYCSKNGIEQGNSLANQIQTASSEKQEPIVDGSQTKQQEL